MADAPERRSACEMLSVIVSASCCSPPSIRTACCSLPYSVAVSWIGTPMRWAMSNEPLLGDGVLALASGGQLQARGHHVPGVGDLDDLLHLAAAQLIDRNASNWVLAVDLIAEGRHSCLDLGHPGGRLLPGGLGGARELAGPRLRSADVMARV